MLGTQIMQKKLLLNQQKYKYYEKFTTFFIHGGNNTIHVFCTNSFNLCLYVHQDQHNSRDTI